LPTEPEFIDPLPDEELLLPEEDEDTDYNYDDNLDCGCCSCCGCDCGYWDDLYDYDEDLSEYDDWDE
jgi:hypothetical protein